MKTVIILCVIIGHVYSAPLTITNQNELVDSHVKHNGKIIHPEVLSESRDFVQPGTAPGDSIPKDYAAKLHDLKQLELNHTVSVLTECAAILKLIDTGVGPKIFHLEDCTDKLGLELYDVENPGVGPDVSILREYAAKLGFELDDDDEEYDDYEDDDIDEDDYIYEDDDDDKEEIDEDKEDDDGNNYNDVELSNFDKNSEQDKNYYRYNI